MRGSRWKLDPSKPAPSPRPSKRRSESEGTGCPVPPSESPPPRSLCSFREKWLEDRASDEETYVQTPPYHQDQEARHLERRNELKGREPDRADASNQHHHHRGFRVPFFHFRHSKRKGSPTMAAKFDSDVETGLKEKNDAVLDRVTLMLEQTRPSSSAKSDVVKSPSLHKPPSSGRGPSAEEYSGCRTFARDEEDEERQQQSCKENGSAYANRAVVQHAPLQTSPSPRVARRNFREHFDESRSIAFSSPTIASSSSERRRASSLNSNSSTSDSPVRPQKPKESFSQGDLGLSATAASASSISATSASFSRRPFRHPTVDSHVDDEGHDSKRDQTEDETLKEQGHVPHPPTSTLDNERGKIHTRKYHSSLELKSGHEIADFIPRRSYSTQERSTTVHPSSLSSLRKPLIPMPEQLERNDIQDELQQQKQVLAVQEEAAIVVEEEEILGAEKSILEEPRSRSTSTSAGRKVYEMPSAGDRVLIRSFSTHDRKPLRALQPQLQNHKMMNVLVPQPPPRASEDSTPKLATVRRVASSDNFDKFRHASRYSSFPARTFAESPATLYRPTAPSPDVESAGIGELPRRSSGYTLPSQALENHNADLGLTAAPTNHQATPLFLASPTERSSVSSISSTFSSSSLFASPTESTSQFGSPRRSSSDANLLNRTGSQSSLRSDTSCSDAYDVCEDQLLDDDSLVELPHFHHRVKTRLDQDRKKDVADELAVLYGHCLHCSSLDH